MTNPERPLHAFYKQSSVPGREWCVIESNLWKCECNRPLLFLEPIGPIVEKPLGFSYLRHFRRSIYIILWMQIRNLTITELNSNWFSLWTGLNRIVLNLQKIVIESYQKSMNPESNQFTPLTDIFNIYLSRVWLLYHQDMYIVQWNQFSWKPTELLNKSSLYQGTAFL